MPSSVIAAYHYNEATHILTIKYVSGIVYEYVDVPVAVYDEMKKWTSKGSFLNKKIKGNYDFRKVEEE